MILLSTLSLIKPLICGNNQSLTYETLWTGIGSDFLISVVKKLNLFHLIDLVALVLLSGAVVLELLHCLYC